jgi:hypothetical protein
MKHIFFLSLFFLHFSSLHTSDNQSSSRQGLLELCREARKDNYTGIDKGYNKALEYLHKKEPDSLIGKKNKTIFKKFGINPIQPGGRLNQVYIANKNGEDYRGMIYRVIKEQTQPEPQDLDETTQEKLKILSENARLYLWRKSYQAVIARGNYHDAEKELITAGLLTDHHIDSKVSAWALANLNPNGSPKSSD